MSRHSNARPHDAASKNHWLPGILVAIIVASVAIIGILTIDYLRDEEPDILQGIGIEEKPLGPRSMSPPTHTPQPIPAEDVQVSGDAAQDYSANSDGLPTGGLDGVDLDGISPGGGLGPEHHDWSTMNPSELAIPQAHLTIPVVPRGLVSIDGQTREMDLPVSFQAGWLTSSSPLTADTGATVIAGHVNWTDGSWAPMSNLYNAAPGMSVLTTHDSGAIQEWVVTKSSSVPQSELSRLFTLTRDNGPRQLVLITCEASVDSRGNLTFDLNHVVTATPKPL
ncbi:MAG: class F sortase [Kocuria sp.]|nr:class F sortase [Kocuria sp.]